MALTVDQKLLKRTKFPPEFDQKVDMRKVNLDVMKKWIGGKIPDLLQHDDEVLVELVCNLLDPTKTSSPFPHIKEIQIQLTGFLDRDAAPFCKELWTLCLSAQVNPQGVPRELLEAKKLEMIQEKIRQEKAAEDIRKRKEEDRVRERDVDNIRQRERGERGRGRGRGNFRGGHGRDFDHRRDSRSPPRYRRWLDDRDPPSRRDVDTYIPNSRGKRPEERRRAPLSPKNRSTSRSVSPVRRRPRSPSSSRSRSPPRYRGQHRRERRRSRSRSNDRGRHGRRGSGRSYKAKRSNTPTDRSRSRSPRRIRGRPDRSRSRSTSNSRSPRRTSRRRTNRKSISPRAHSRSPARSLTPPRDRNRRRSRHRRSPSLSEDDSRRSRADVRKDKIKERHKRSPTRSRSRSRTRSPPRRRRLPSVERYEPVPKRHRNTSSMEKDGRLLDNDKRSPNLQSNPMEVDSPEESKKNRKLTESELREALLKQKLIARRRASQDAA